MASLRDCLAEALKDRYAIVISLRTESGYDPLRWHSACQALLRMTNLET